MHARDLYECTCAGVAYTNSHIKTETELMSISLWMVLVVDGEADTLTIDAYTIIRQIRVKMVCDCDHLAV